MKKVLLVSLMFVMSACAVRETRHGEVIEPGVVVVDEGHRPPPREHWRHDDYRCRYDRDHHRDWRCD